MARPIMPAPSGDAVADLYNQLAGLRRQSNQLTLNLRQNRSQLGAQRKLFLSQLADMFGQQQGNALMDFSARGLQDSGIQHEGVARLQNEYQGQRAAFQTDYQGQLNQLLQGYQGQQADILARRQALETAYNRAKAQRAAQLRLAGFGG